MLQVDLIKCMEYTTSMKVGKIAKLGKKGQIVIPQEARKWFGLDENSLLHISFDETTVFIQPIETTEQHVATENTFKNVLQRTKGSWATSEKETSKVEKKHKLELEASKSRKNAW